MVYNKLTNNPLNKIFISNDIFGLIKSSWSIYLGDKEKKTYSMFYFGYLKSWETDRTRAIEPELRGQEFGFYICIDLLKNSERYLLYPKIGFNVSNYQLTLADLNNTQVDYNQIITGLSGERNFKSNGVCSGELALGFEIKIKLLGYYFFLGPEVSYIINFNKLRWETLNGASVNNMPSLKTNGFKVGFLMRIPFDFEALSNLKRNKKKAKTEITE